MRKSLIVFACLGIVWPLDPARAAPAENVVSFQVDGQKVVGTLELPEGVSAPPVVLMLHGLLGSRNEMQTPFVKEGLFARAANAWAAMGIASLRIDFRGRGESEGNFEDSTISAEVKDGLAAIEFLQSEKAVDASRLALVGWSNGGAVATAVAGRSAHPVKAVALWNAVTVPAAGFANFLGADYLKAGLASGGKAVATKLPWGGELTLKTGFFEDMFKVDPAAELAQYPGPVLVAVGTNDPIVTPQPAMGQLLLTYHKGHGELWVRPMDHIFNSMDKADTLDELIAATGAFIEKYDK